MRRAGTGGGSVGVSPCHVACPVGINVKAYVGLIAAGRPVEAAGVIRERNPLPAACGRICSAPCERECARAEDGSGPVAIRALKRFAADVEGDRDPAAARDRPGLRGPHKVAVVGAGPAGLVAAHDLARAGRPVVLFEASAVPGGLLVAGVPAFRLPRPSLFADIQAILALGVELRAGAAIDLAAPDAPLREGFAAVILAAGATWGPPPAIPGLTPANTLDAALVVRDAARGQALRLDRRVAVVAAPGGNWLGLSAARLARRAGAERVVLLLPAPRSGWPLDEEDLAGAERDGVELAAPAHDLRAVGSSGTVTLSWRAAPGLPAPEPLTVETVLAAGPRAVLLPSGSPLRRGPLGTIAADPVTLETSVAGVFAAGEIVAGPRGVIEAMASGRRAARSVLRRLRGISDLRAASDLVVPAVREYGAPMPPRGGTRWRPDSKPAAVLTRIDEPDPGLTEPQAVAEARRCRMCGPCEECRVCTPTCDFVLVAGTADAGRPSAARVVRPAPASRPARPIDGTLVATVDAERCVACGLCAEVCPWSIPRLATRKGGATAATIDARLCRSCGTCAGACPAEAIAQPGWPLPPPAPAPEVRS